MDGGLAFAIIKQDIFLIILFVRYNFAELINKK